MLLADGISASGAASIYAVAGVPITNAVIATYTVTDPSGAPGTKWRALADFGDGQSSKQIVPIPVGTSGFEFEATHTYATPGNYTITVMIAVPGSQNPNANTVTTTAFVRAQPTLTSIGLSPASPGVVVGKTQQLTATGTFSDGSTEDLTSQVTWASANTSVATISNRSGSQGLATAMTIGTSTVSAAMDGISGSTVLTVLAPPSLIGNFKAISLNVKAHQQKTFHGQVVHFNEPHTSAKQFSAIVDWGDQTADGPGRIQSHGKGRYAVIGSHRYSAPGVYHITVIIRDASGQEIAGVSSVRVIK
jgi:hypothetical protein